MIFDDLDNVRNARDAHLAAGGYTLDSYTDPHLHVKLGRWVLRFPNPGLLALHDLHHVAANFDTTLLGEGEISAFEMRAGAGTPFIYFLCFASAGIALFMSPRRVWQAWRLGRGARSLYGRKPGYEQLLAMNVGQLRTLMQMKEEHR